MAFILLILAGQLMDYTAKVSLLVLLCWGTGYRVYFATLATIHVAANLHSAFAYCRQLGIGSRRVAPAVALLLGVATPLLQAAHCCDAVAAWWASQEFWVGRPRGRTVLDVVFEGLAFVVVAFRLMQEEAIEPPEGVSTSTFAAILAMTYAASLVTVATTMVFWDSALCLQLSKELYRRPRGREQISGLGNIQGIRGLWRFVFQLSFRGSEVAGRVALLTWSTLLVGPSPVVAYSILCYIANVMILFLNASEREVDTNWRAMMVVSVPLLFADLPHFVDSPKHFVAAQATANLICGCRAVELMLALGVVVSGYFLEGHVDGPGPLWRFVGSPSPVVEGSLLQIVAAWHILCQKKSIQWWLLLLLAHYLCIAARHCRHGVTTTPSARLSPSSSSGILSTGAVIPSPAEEKAFWPAACGLAALLWSTACDCAPPVWPLGGRSGWPMIGGRRPQMEDFDTIRLLGYGEFGKVFLVRHRATLEQFAMKRLSREFYSRRGMTDKASREIDTLRLAGRHPFVVQLVCVVETPREWVMVMEYCPRSDLQQLLLAEGSPGLPLDQTMRISAEVCLALEHLHTKGIVFRDLKLENVVLDADGHAKITDFGLAKQYAGGRDAIAEASQSGGVYPSFTKTFCGSYGYAAPEVNPRRQVHGFATDLYSFGVLVLMLLMGGKVYHDSSREPPVEQRLPPETPEDLRSILGTLSFDFYWASHHLLKAARATHRVEVNLNGMVSIASRGPCGVRRQPRPRRPPTSPREVDPAGRWLPQSKQPYRFPAAAVVDTELVRRRWELALDLVRCLTEELPERRGTVATLKQHPFFMESIPNWWMVYPKKWLVERLEGQLRRRCSHTGPSNRSLGITQRLQKLHIADVAMLQDNEGAQEQFLGGQSLQEVSRSLSAFSLSPLGPSTGLGLGTAVWHTAPSISPMTPMTNATTTPLYGAGTPTTGISRSQSWVSHYGPIAFSSEQGS